MTGGDTAQIKKININLIRRAMLTGEAWTKDTLSACTGLSTATCRKILMEMVAAGEAAELSHADPKGGRPAHRFRYNRQFTLFLLARINNSRDAQGVTAAVVDSGGETIRTLEYSARNLTLDALLTTLGELVREHPRIGSIAVSYPGVVYHGKTVNWATWPILNGLDLKSEIQQKFGIPSSVENDINLAAWGYASKLSCRKANIAYIGIPEGSMPGCGLVIGGKLLRGSRGFAGEVMFIENLPREELEERLRSQPHAMAEMVWSMLRPITALLDPQQAVIAGKIFPAAERHYLLEKCEKMFRHEFLPNLVFREDHLEDNTCGLLDFARRCFYAVGNED